MKALRFVIAFSLVFAAGILSAHFIDPQMRHRALWRAEQAATRERIGAELQAIDLEQLEKTDMAQLAIVGTFLDSFCGKPGVEGDAFHAGATAVMSVVAQRAGLGPYTTAQAQECLIVKPLTPEFLARLAAAKEDAETRRAAMRHTGSDLPNLTKDR